jgi:hypothetical protein
LAAPADDTVIVGYERGADRAERRAVLDRPVVEEAVGAVEGLS